MQEKRKTTMTEPNLNHTIALLARTPATLNALLRDLPETWTLTNGVTIALADVWREMRERR